VGIYYHDKYIKYGTCLEPDELQLFPFIIRSRLSNLTYDLTITITNLIRKSQVVR
jgi:hypothetical protein